MSAAGRHAVQRSGLAGARPMLFAHGLGCDQAMWRFVAPAFADRFEIITFDHVGMGAGDPAGWDPDRHATLDGYTADVLDLCDELGLRDVVFVGHSVSAMIGVLAAVRRPDLFGALVLVAPSPRHLDDDGWTGGLTQADLDGMLGLVDENVVVFADTLAPTVVGHADRPELAGELAAAWCRADPEILRAFTRTTFTGDHRDALAHVPVPTLVLQCSDDALAPEAVGRYVAGQVPDAELVILDATGHCPNLSAPAETVAAIEAFL